MKLSALLLLAAFFLTLLFVPFRHRTLVGTPDGGFDFREERVWAPLWRQPSTATGVAEYPFRWLLGAWGGLGLIGVAGVWVDRRKRPTTGDAA